MPGPLLGLVIVETLRVGLGAGALVSLAPLVADGPIIALTFYVLLSLPPKAPALLGLAGGVYVVYLGWASLRASGRVVPKGDDHHCGGTLASLFKGTAVNLLNPHPYVFWLTLGGPLVAESYRGRALAPIVCFVGAFYACLVGTKLLVALLVHRGRASFGGRGHRAALRCSGLLLTALGLYLFGASFRDTFF
jgi:threonine/homoserine/homoserine lactone efflux protein